MKCHIVFSAKNGKPINFSSTEFAHTVIKVKETHYCQNEKKKKKKKKQHTKRGLNSFKQTLFSVKLQLLMLTFQNGHAHNHNLTHCEDSFDDASDEKGRLIIIEIKNSSPVLELLHAGQFL